MLIAIVKTKSAVCVLCGYNVLTQQLVKMEYLKDDERTYTRKLREALLAIWLELRTSKQAILTHYLNRVYLGDGAYGMEAAARLYSFVWDDLASRFVEAAKLDFTSRAQIAAWTTADQHLNRGAGGESAQHA